jgi:GTPase
LNNKDHTYPTDFKSGFAAITGAPNVGKSTMLNRVLGQKISITSKKPQTTRNRVLGILHRPFSQIVFLDTPGVHRAKGALNVRIVDAALSVLDDVDMILLVADASSPDPPSEQILIKNLKKRRQPVFLALNKIDLVKKQVLLRVIDEWTALYDFEAIIPISAKTGVQLDVLVAEMEKRLPDGPPLFPEDAVTDMPERFIAGEMIREKVFRLTGQEIPYAVAITVESFKEDVDRGLVTIEAAIHVERNSQKGMLIGKKGAKLKEIGTAARKEIEKMTGTRVFLKLFVRVQKNWRQDTRALRRFGY